MTTPVRSVKTGVFDHLGNKFKNNPEMYKYWNIDARLARARINLGWSLEKVLTEPVQVHDEVQDHLGNTFENETEMAKYYGLCQRDIYTRRKRGWSLEKILTTPKADKSKQCKDHLGNEFSSQKEMYDYYGVTKSIVINRKRLGWSLERILTEPVFTVSKYRDPVSGEDLTIKELSERYGVHVNAIGDRIRNNYPIVRVVDISMIIQSRYNQINQTKYNLTVVKRIQKGKDVFECYIDNGDDTSTFKIMSYDMIDEYCLEQYKKLHNIT